MDVYIRRCWSCCGTLPTETTAPLTPWTTPSLLTSRSWTTPVHRSALLPCTPIDTSVHPITCLLLLQERESQKLLWLQRCVEEMNNEKWSIPALKQMKEICLLYVEVRALVHKLDFMACLKSIAISTYVCMLCMMHKVTVSSVLFGFGAVSHELRAPPSNQPLLLSQ